MIDAGEWAEVAEVSGEAAWVGRLAELGIREGCRLQVLQSGSPCLLQVANCRLCLRPADCAQILVQPVARDSATCPTESR
jgi:Fe2+ transport system protein FeoA